MRLRYDKSSVASLSFQQDAVGKITDCVVLFALAFLPRCGYRQEFGDQVVEQDIVVVPVW
jgi:hypothetical protein